MENVNFLYKSIDQYLSEVNREYFLVNAGYNKQQDFAKIINKWKFIFDDKYIKTLMEVDSQVSIKAAHYIRKENVNLSIAGLEDKISNYFMNKQIAFNGRYLDFRDAFLQDVKLDNKQDRKKLYLETWKNTGIIKKIKEQSNDIFFRELKAEDGNLSLSGISGVTSNELLALKNECDKFLNETNDLYNRGLQEYLNDYLHVDINDLGTYDLSYVITIIKSTLSSSINLNKLINTSVNRIGINNYTFRIDSYPRFNKSERAFCSPIWIPQSVYLVIKGSNSILDQKTALHEMGHALHYSNTLPNLNPIDKRIGEGALSEGYGFIFDLLYLNGFFLKSIYSSSPNVKMIKWYQIYLIRKYIAKFFYELEFIKNPLSDGNFNHYKHIMGNILGINETTYSDDDLSYLTELDPWFYEIQYLRAWMFAGGFLEFLDSRYTEEWWKSKEVGKIMINLWKMGQKPTINSIVADMGLSDLSFSYILNLVN